MKIFHISIPSFLVWLATVGQVFACQHLVISAADTKSFNTSQAIFQIAADSAPCTGLIQRRCLIVNDELFYSGITGYDHQEGLSRVIRIERIQFCDPDVFNSCPQDVGIYKYRLLEVIE